jgi:hypothetical protein
MTLPAAVALPMASGATFLAQQPGGGNNGGQGADFGKSSPVGLLLLLLFFIAVVFLIRSMTKHLKRVPASFDPSQDGPEAQREDRDNGDGGDSDAEPTKRTEHADADQGRDRTTPGGPSA